MTHDQKNALFEFAVQIGLNPQEFDWEKRPSRDDSKLLVSAIVHLPTAYYFVFDFSNRKRHMRLPRGGYAPLTEHQVEFSPGDDTSREVHQCRLGERPLQFAEQWLARVKKALETPDLWEELARQSRFLAQSTSFDVEDLPFSPDEVRLIDSRLDEILEQVVSTHDLNVEQTRRFGEGIDYLKKASRRFGRNNWIMVAISVLGSIVPYLLPPSAAPPLFKGLVDLIREIVNVKFLLP